MRSIAALVLLNVGVPASARIQAIFKQRPRGAFGKSDTGPIRSTKRPGRCAVAALVTLTISLVAAGCTRAELEYDRMTGTAFPQPETVDGQEVTFTSIYLQGNLILTVSEDDTDIAPLTGPADPMDPDQYDYITLAEIETLESANRSAAVPEDSWPCSFWIFDFTCTRYNVYGIVVDHYLESDDGTRRTGTMGWMYAPDDRRAFVNFYKHSTNNSDNGKFLRSTAHEIGHALNLSHCDGDGSTTIMNQTGVVGDTYDYDFSSSSLDHLQNHDRDAVWPGIGSRHYACPHSH